VAAWSIMTALCGAAQTFAQLMLARIGVGIGEAGCNPSAHSLIADYFPFNKRAFALSAYSTGVPIGSLLGLALGGWVGEAYGWRTAFMAVGLPGLLLAILVKLMLKEPPRGAADGMTPRAEQKAPGLGITLKYLWQAKSFRAICAAAAADAFVGYGLLMWLPTYLIRSFDLSPSEIGLRLGLMVGIAGIIGTLCSGFLTDRLGKRDSRFYCWMPAMIHIIAFIGCWLVFSSRSSEMVFLLLILPLITLPASAGPIYAAVQSVAPVQMRATAAAVLLLTLNLIGMGLGPTFVGLVSDLLTPRFGADSLRIALLITASSYGIGTLAAYIASRFFVNDLKRISNSAGTEAPVSY